MNTGIHDLSFSDYHKLDGWGSSALKAMRRGPPSRVLYERNRPDSDTDATILGTAVHCALLTPDLYATSYDVKPEEMTFASNAGKAWRADPVRAGLKILSFDVAVMVDVLVHVLHEKAAVGASLKAATSRESSLLWKCSITGEMCKARPDWIEGKWIYDLKCSRHASGGSLAYRAYVEGWFHQLAHYRTGAIELGLPISGGRLVVVEPTAPHFVHCLEVKRDALDLLEIENVETVKALQECRVSGVWPGTPDSWTKVDVPASANMDAFNDVVLAEPEEDLVSDQA